MGASHSTKLAFRWWSSMIRRMPTSFENFYCRVCRYRSNHCRMIINFTGMLKSSVQFDFRMVRKVLLVVKLCQLFEYYSKPEWILRWAIFLNIGFTVHIFGVIVDTVFSLVATFLEYLSALKFDLNICYYFCCL